jgi:hypothetical protein
MSYLLALICLPLLVLLYVSTTVITQAVAIHNIDLQDTVERVARAAAYQVTKDSQAAGQPRINTSSPDQSTARQVFQDTIAAELGLDPINLQPLPGSPVKSVSYTLLVYNVDAQYESYGAEFCRKYVFSNGSLNESDLYPADYPASFAVTNNDIILSDSGAVTTLERPGVVAMISASMSVVGENDPGVVSRWCVAKVISGTGI